MNVDCELNKLILEQNVWLIRIILMIITSKIFFYSLNWILEWLVFLFKLILKSKIVYNYLSMIIIFLDLLLKTLI